MVNNMDVENPKVLPKAKSTLPVVRSARVTPAYTTMIEEVNATFDIYPIMAFFDEGNVKRQNQYSSRILQPFLHPSLYSAIKKVLYTEDQS